MSRYIDADKLFLNFNDWAFAESPDERHSDVPEYSEHKIHEMIYRTINEAMSAIEQQPTADVVEVKRGKWYSYTRFRMNNWEGGYGCTCCKEWSAKESNYCPNCGAYMREGREDERNI